MPEDPDTFQTKFFLGLDLGQTSDPSALTVTERRVPIYRHELQGTERGKPRYVVRHIKRFDLGTSYPDVVRKVAAVKEAPQTGHDPPIILDATGLGGPVVDQFHEEGLAPVEIVFTSGQEPTKERGTGQASRYGVPKRDLATLVQSLLQTHRLTIAEGLKEAGQLVQEMRTFRVKMTDSGHARFEHANESDSDDVLLSLACGLWYAERAPDLKPLKAGHIILALND